jgi:hypothetical protein
MIRALGMTCRTRCGTIDGSELESYFAPHRYDGVFSPIASAPFAPRKHRSYHAIPLAKCTGLSKKYVLPAS